MTPVIGPEGAEVRYEYDGAGRVEALSIKDGLTLAFAYDDTDRLIQGQ